jgi:hypothetical protein
MRSVCLLHLLPLLLLAPLVVGAQSTATGAAEPLQRGFSSVELGMSFEAVEENLQADAFFRYRGEPDVSFSPAAADPVISADGSSFITRGLFQFNSDRLFVITLVLDVERLGYFSVFESLVDQYGDPVSLDPQTAEWRDSETTIRLERPLSVKYIDQEVFTELVEAGRLDESLEEVSRDRFLEEL